MNAPRVHIIIALLIVCFLTALRAQEPTVALDATDPATVAEAQLQINKTTLLESKTAATRISTASFLLSSDNPAAREILLEILRRTDNPEARAAVCEALNPTRMGQKSLRNREDFVKPLIAILTSEESPAIAKPAAEATLLFGYSQVQQELEKAVTDPSLSVNVRLNIVYALRRHPDKQAVAKLITLLDSPDAQIVEAARNALGSVGFPVSSEPGAARQMLAELQQRGVEAFLRDRLIRQEMQVRELETDRDGWQKRYLTALSRLYDSLADEAAKNAFMAEQLKASEVPVKCWALDKLDELRNANAQLKLSALQTILLDLISDPSRQVRQKTARLLARVGEFNAAKPLADQLRLERDEAVKRDLLVALREACYAGSLATTAQKVPEEVRKEALEWAVKFLNDTDPEKSRTGAEVIGRLLEQDGFKPEDVDKYLTALAERYVQASLAADPGLRRSLLAAMGGLCAARSTCREQAVKLYGAMFEQALGDKADAGVRQAAVEGLVSVDKSIALRKLRENNMAADPSVIIRQKVVEVAGDVGGPQDLDWLVEKLGVPVEGEPAWQAMLKIFKRSNLTTLVPWVPKIENLAAADKLVVEQRIGFFTLVEQAAKNENRADLLKQAQENLARLYILSSNLMPASEILKTLLAAAATEEETRRVHAQLLQVYLKSGKIDQVSELISKCLSDKDLDLSPEGFLVKSVEEHLNSPSTTDSGVLLAALQQINGNTRIRNPAAAQAWQVWVSRWTEKLAKGKKIEDSNKLTN